MGFDKKHPYWYHRPFLNRAAVRVSGRGCGFESQEQMTILDGSLLTFVQKKVKVNISAQLMDRFAVMLQCIVVLLQYVSR